MTILTTLVITIFHETQDCYPRWDLSFKCSSSLLISSMQNKFVGQSLQLECIKPLTLSVP